MTRTRWIALAVAAACLVVAGFIVIPRLGQDKDCGYTSYYGSYRPLNGSSVPLTDGDVTTSVAFDC